MLKHSVTHSPEDNELFEDINTYHYGKGGYEDVVREITSGANGSCAIEVEKPEVLEFVYEQMYQAWSRYQVSNVVLTWREALDEKDMSTSVGYPACRYTSTYLDLIKQIQEDEPTRDPVEVLAEEMEECEQLVLQGSCPPVVWRPFGKLDKYSTSKVQSRKFRTVSTGPLFLLTLMRRYYSVATKHLETSIPQMYLFTGPEACYEKVWSRMAGTRTFGVDYTSFDKNSVKTLNIRSFMLLDKLTGKTVPRPIFDYICLGITQPMSLVYNNSGEPELFNLNGTNPSGQLMTSWCNTATHAAHNCTFLWEKYHVHPVDYLSDMSMLRSIMTGDDGVESVDHMDPDTFAQELATFIQSAFNIPCKLDLLNLPDGTRTCYKEDLVAPYLNKVMISPTPQTMYLIPVHPRRFIPRLYFLVEGDYKGPKTEVLQTRLSGIVNEIQPLIFHEYFNPSLPTNEIVESILKYAKEMNVRVPSVYECTDEFVIRLRD